MFLTKDLISIIGDKADIYMTDMIGDLPVSQKVDIYADSDPLHVHRNEHFSCNWADIKESHHLVQLVL